MQTNKTQAASDIRSERNRQVDVEGWSSAHDDKYEKRQLYHAAKSYFIHAMNYPHVGGTDQEKPPIGWAWEAQFWKPKNPRRDLVRAGALILAEQERIRRCFKDEAYSRQGGLEADSLYILILNEIERLDRVSTHQKTEK
jgi:hypothetical protein